MADNEGKIGADGAPEPDAGTPRKKLTPEAERALAEAEARRAAAKPAERPAEYNGPKGEEPTRYGDWERKGIATDF